MSGYASEREVRDVIKATLWDQGLDPRDFSVSGILRDAFTHAGSYYGWRAGTEEEWRRALVTNRRTQNGGVRRGRATATA